MICPMCGYRGKFISPKFDFCYTVKYGYVQSYNEIIGERQGMPIREKVCMRCGFILNSKELKISVKNKDFYAELARELRKRGISYNDRISLFNKAKNWWSKNKVQLNFNGYDASQCVDAFLNSLNHQSSNSSDGSGVTV